MGKESISGSAFYRGKGLVPITVYVKKSTHARYEKRASKKGTSIQFEAAAVLEKNRPKR